MFNVKVQYMIFKKLFSNINYLQLIGSLNIYCKMDNIQNMQPNCPELAQLILQNISYQNEQSVKKTLFKESLIKLSLDKDFEHIFHHQQPNNKIVEERPMLIQVPDEIQQICQWLQNVQQYGGIAHLPQNMMPRFAHILHQKVQSLAIIVTEYQSWWFNKMDEMSRLSTLKWGFLSPNLANQDKAKILELYELKKLKLLFISPSLFKHEEFHQFQCDILVFCDLHLYNKSENFFNTIIKRTSPNRLLALHNSLSHEHYSDFKLSTVNRSDNSSYNFISLKAPLQQKCKTMLSYISKNNFKNVLVLGNRKSDLMDLNKKLQMQALTVFNMFDNLTANEILSFTSQEIFTRIDKKEDKILEVIKKASGYNITLSLYFDPLRFGQFDAVVFYNFLDVTKYVNQCPQVKNKLMLLVEEDYCYLRNSLTCDFIPLDHLQKIMMKILQKPRKKEDNGMKRCYSDHVDNRLLQCFSVSKQMTTKMEQKVLKLNWFSKQYDVSLKILNRMLQALAYFSVIKIQCKIPFELQIEEQCINNFRKIHPKASQIRRKVNLLSLSTCLQKTTSSILSGLRDKEIKYKITEEAVQIIMLKDFQEVDWQAVVAYLNQTIQQAADILDKSFEMFKQCAYSSMELTRREKILNKKDKLINFPSNAGKVPKSAVLESSHAINLLVAEIEEWLRNCEVKLDQHELILILQGVDRIKAVQFKNDPIYGRYWRYKYEELLGAVQKITKNKRIKL